MLKLTSSVTVDQGGNGTFSHFIKNASLQVILTFVKKIKIKDNLTTACFIL